MLIAAADDDQQRFSIEPTQSKRECEIEVNTKQKSSKSHRHKMFSLKAHLEPKTIQMKKKTR